MSITNSNLKVREVIHQVVNDPDYKEVSRIPIISYHQLALILIAYIAVFGGITMFYFTEVSLWIIYPIMIFGFYTAFTPLHDSTHRAVSSNKILNDLLGTLSGFILFPLSNAIGYRYLHLAHHRYVGDKELDPDEPLVAIPTKYFPLGYICLFFPGFIWAYWLISKAWERTPIKTRAIVLMMIAGNILFHIAWFLSPFAYEYLIIFFIPNRLAIAYTSLTFAHTPHPEGLKWDKYPFQSTFTLTGNKYFLWSLYGQKHHAMHHFLPHIPWYKYFKVWNLANGVFRKQNIPKKNVFSKPDINFKKSVINGPKNKRDATLEVKVVEIKAITDNIKMFVFQSVNGNQDLPPFTAGAHIRIHLLSGKIRSYSLVNPPYESNRYEIAVKLNAYGQGGSMELHKTISKGSILKISYPQNNFVLYENVKKYILFAGGIGITPLLSMAHRLTEIEKYFELHICVKSLEELPFRYELKNWTFAPNVEIHLDKFEKSSMNIKRILANPNNETLIYSCGPLGFNQWIKGEAINSGWKKEQVKQELFSRHKSTPDEAKAFQLVLNKTGKSIMVKKEETIIDALQFNNIQVPYSCLQGTCGTCITRVIEGKVDHRDAVLNEEDKIENNKMCICVSRAKEDILVLDL